MLKVKNSHRPSQMAIEMFLEVANRVEMDVTFFSLANSSNESEYIGILEKVVDGQAMYYISHMNLINGELGTAMEGKIDNTPYSFPKALEQFTNKLKGSAKPTPDTNKPPSGEKTPVDSQVQNQNKTHLWVPMAMQLQFKDTAESKGYTPFILSKTYKGCNELDGYVGLASNIKDNLVHIARFNKNGEIEIEPEGSELPKALMKMAIQLEA